MQEEEGEEEGGGKSKQESLHVIIPTRRELLHSMGSHATLGFYVSRWGTLFLGKLLFAVKSATM